MKRSSPEFQVVVARDADYMCVAATAYDNDKVISVWGREGTVPVPVPEAQDSSMRKLG